MGLFSSSYKEYFGVSHSRMIENKDIPRALIDSTASYVSEAPDTGGLDLVDYNEIAIEQSLSTKVSRVHTWIKSSPSATDGIKPITPTYFEPVGGQVDSAVNRVLQELHKDQTIDIHYINYQDTSMYHYTYDILFNDYSFEPTSNSIITTTSTGQTLHGYLESVTMYLAPRLYDVPDIEVGELIPGPVLGYSFLSGYTPFREEDREAGHKPNVVQRSIDNISYFYFDVVKRSTMQVATEYTRTDVYDEEETELLSSNTSTSTVTTGAPENHIDRYIETISSNTESTEYSLVSSKQNEDLTWTKVYKRTETKTDELKVTYVFKDDYTSVRNYDKAIKQYQDALDNLPLGATQEEKDALLQESFDYFISLGGEERIAQVGYTVDGFYNYATISLEDLEEILVELKALETSNFLPDIYIRANWDFLFEKKKPENKEAYRDMKRVAKKLGMYYDQLSEQVKEDTEDLDKIPSMYMTFGIKLGAEHETELEYIYNYLDRYYTVCDTEGTTSGPGFTPVINEDTFNEYTGSLRVLSGKEARAEATSTEAHANIGGKGTVVSDKSFPVQDTGFIIMDPYSFRQRFVVLEGSRRVGPDEETYTTTQILDHRVQYPRKGVELRYGDSFSDKWLSAEYVTKMYLYGSIGPVGTIKRYLGDYEKPYGTTKWDRDGSYNLTPKGFDTIPGLISLHKQIAEDHFVVLQAHNLNVTKRVLHSSAGYEDTDDTLLPLDLQLYRDMFKSFKDRERFIYKSLYVEAQTYQRIKVKWYQKSWFKLVMIAIAIGSFFFGPAGVQAVGWLQAMVNLAVMTVVVELTVWALGKVLSPEQMQIVAGLVTIAGIAGKFGGWGGVQINTRAFTVFLLNTKTLLAVAGKLRELSIETVNDEFKEMERTHLHRMAQLEAKEANVAYRPSTGLNYQNEDLRVYPVMQDSSLDSMISRTLNPNPGRLSIDYSHSYVDYILGLPTPQETVYKRYNNFN